MEWVNERNIDFDIQLHWHANCQVHNETKLCEQVKAVSLTLLRLYKHKWLIIFLEIPSI